MNDLVKFGGGALPANPSELAAGLANVSQSIRTGGGMHILRLLTDGHYAYGQENIEPEEGSRWAINPYSMQHGFCCWVDSELMGEVMVPFNRPLPPQSDLQDFGGDWNQQVSLILQCLDGEDTGTQVVYKGSSNGLRNAVKKLIEYILTQVAEDDSHPVPVVELEVDHYTHKKYGRTYFPVLTPVEWMSMEGPSAEAGDEEADPPEEAEQSDVDEVTDEMEGKAKEPARRSRRSAPKDESDQQKPARRRRGAAKEPEPEAKATPRRRRSQ